MRLAFSLTLSHSKQTNLLLAGVGQGGVCSVPVQACGNNQVMTSGYG